LNTITVLARSTIGVSVNCPDLSHSAANKQKQVVYWQPEERSGLHSKGNLYELFLTGGIINLLK